MDENWVIGLCFNGEKRVRFRIFVDVNMIELDFLTLRGNLYNWNHLEIIPLSELALALNKLVYEKINWYHW